jgi:hypothetical protein
MSEEEEEEEESAAIKHQKLTVSNVLKTLLRKIQKLSKLGVRKLQSLEDEKLQIRL